MTTQASPRIYQYCYRYRSNHPIPCAGSRTATAHDYSGEKAAETLLIVDAFIQDAIRLYQTITRKTWVLESKEE